MTFRFICKVVTSKIWWYTKKFASKLGISERTLREYENDQIEPSESVQLKLFELKEKLRVKVDLDATYYHIQHNGNTFDGDTCWIGYVDEENGNFTEIREFSEFAGIDVARYVEEDEIVINTVNDIFIYLNEYTRGYVRKDICEHHMRYYLEPIYVTEEEQTKLYKYIESLYS